MLYSPIRKPTQERILTSQELVTIVKHKVHKLQIKLGNHWCEISSI
jgi:hypothetical protein